MVAASLFMFIGIAAADPVFQPLKNLADNHGVYECVFRYDATVDFLNALRQYVHRALLYLWSHKNNCKSLKRRSPQENKGLLSACMQPLLLIAAVFRFAPDDNWKNNLKRQCVKRIDI